MQTASKKLNEMLTLLCQSYKNHCRFEHTPGCPANVDPQRSHVLEFFQFQRFERVVLNMAQSFGVGQTVRVISSYRITTEKCFQCTWFHTGTSIHIQQNCFVFVGTLSLPIRGKIFLLVKMRRGLTRVQYYCDGVFKLFLNRKKTLSI